jgi:hypothetical protein
LKDGGTITTPSDHTVHWATAHLRQRPSFRRTKGQSCTNFQIGPLKWGCSTILFPFPTSSQKRYHLCFYALLNHFPIFQVPHQMQSNDSDALQ